MNQGITRLVQLSWKGGLNNLSNLSYVIFLCSPVDVQCTCYGELRFFEASKILVYFPFNTFIWYKCISNLEEFWQSNTLWKHQWVSWRNTTFFTYCRPQSFQKYCMLSLLKKSIRISYCVVQNTDPIVVPVESFSLIRRRWTMWDS